MRNPIQDWFARHGGEDPDWGHYDRGQGFERSPVHQAVHELICAASIKDIATRAKNKDLLNCANGAIETLLDEYCGTPPRRKWPFPGPNPQVLEIVAELSVVANFMQPGGLKTELEDLATKLVMRTNDMSGKTP